MSLVLQDMIFAAITGFGFAYASNPPMRILFLSAVLAAVGHSFRFALMEIFHFPNLAVATFCASFLVGCLGMMFAKITKTPAEIIAFPALLPMIPGMYAYRAILSLFAFINAGENAVKEALSGANAAIQSDLSKSIEVAINSGYISQEGIEAAILAAKSRYLVEFFDNFLTTLSVTLALAVGVSVTLLLFFEQSFMVSRHSKLFERYKHLKRHLHLSTSIGSRLGSHSRKKK